MASVRSRLVVGERAVEVAQVEVAGQRGELDGRSPRAPPPRPRGPPASGSSTSATTGVAPSSRMAASFASLRVMPTTSWPSRDEPREQLLAQRARGAGYQDLHGTSSRLGSTPMTRERPPVTGVTVVRSVTAPSAAPSGTSPRIRSAARSASAITGAFVLPRGTVGITDASTTRRPSTPRTLQLAVHHGGRLVAHPAGADRVVERLEPLAAVRLDVLVGVRVRARSASRWRARRAGPISQISSAGAHARDHRRHVVRVLQVVVDDQRLRRRVGRAERHEAAALRLQHARADARTRGRRPARAPRTGSAPARSGTGRPAPRGRRACG